MALDIYFIDVEGGQSTLFVSPSGKSLLVDAGSPGARDADRIVATAKSAGLTQIDYLVVTHYDADHVGGVKDVADRMPMSRAPDDMALIAWLEHLTVPVGLETLDDPARAHRGACG